MLKRLRRAFTAIFCALLVLVLSLVLGSTLMISYVSLRESVRTALEYELERDPELPPVIGGDDAAGAARMLVASVEVGPTGTILTSNRAVVGVDDADLAAIVAQATEHPHSLGRLRSSHLAWLSEREGGTTHIAIADTSSLDLTFRRQVRGALSLFAGLALALFLASWALARWALAPVERAWEQQRRFVADASHELKTPLAVILANTQILRAADSGVPERSRAWLDSTAEEAGRMRGLVEGMLDLARSEDALGRGRRPRQEVDLSELVERCALQFDAVAFEHGCTVETDVEGGVRVRGDAEALERLCTILLDNACKYARPGTPVRVRLARSQGRARLSVTNLGEPIPREDLPHIFERFYRSNKARTSAGGTGSYGLGLAIAKGIVEEHRGTIRVTSDREAGTTFTASL